MKGLAFKVFGIHGWICATYPCEVLFCFITILFTMVSFIEWDKENLYKSVNHDFLSIDVLFMTLIRCGSLLYIYYQLQNLSDIGSKYLLGIVGLFIVYSCIFFCCTVLMVLPSSVSDLKDAVFFFLLLSDFNKARYLAQYAVESSSYQDAKKNIAESIALLGPTLTLDTIAEALLIGAGTLTGVSRVEQMCGFAILSILVNYLILITFYPACLSIILELTHRCSAIKPQRKSKDEAKKLQDSKSNPVLQRVKIIMSAGLFLVHGLTRWSVNPHGQCKTIKGSVFPENINIDAEPPSIVKWLNAGLDQAILMIIVCVLFIKYTFFGSFWPVDENMENLIKKQANSSDSSSSKESISSKATRDTKSSQTDAKVLLATCSENAKDEKGTEPLSLDDEKGTGLRSLDESLKLWKSQDNCKDLNEKEILNLLESGKVSHRLLESKFKDPQRCVAIRRKFIATQLSNPQALDNLPNENYDYAKLQGVCCENVIGYMQIPVGVAGPLKINGKSYLIPMATTEGALIASTSRGCKALSESYSGVTSICFKDGMTRAPVIQMPSVKDVCKVFDWIRKDQNSDNSILKSEFNGTSHYVKLLDINLYPFANTLYIRFVATTGDAMGMNMVSRGTEAALRALRAEFPELTVISISGNVCTDKKPSSVNWVLGRGKHIICEATIPSKVIASTLKTTTTKLVRLNEMKNYRGSAVAGSIGGNNAHAANIVAAIFIACGQDPAQVVESSSCLTVMEKVGDDDLYVSVTMPCIEVGTVGGGTNLSPQAAMLNMLDVKGPSLVASGDHAKQLAMIIASTVMAGELSLMAALNEHTLVSSHLTLNRPNAAHSTS